MECYKSPLYNFEFSPEHMWFVDCYMEMELLWLKIEKAHGRQNWRTYDDLLLDLQLMLTAMKHRPHTE